MNNGEDLGEVPQGEPDLYPVAAQSEHGTWNMDTIVDTIKEMAENRDKAKLQEKEIEKLDKDLDENKEEVHYLRNKWEYKRDMIDDLEDKIKKRMMNVRN